MTRDETIALFLECEEKRKAVYEAAMAAGKTAYEAENAGHDAAKAHWNAWAEGMLAEKKRLQEAGEWEAKKKAWEEAAKADFFSVRFETQAKSDADKADGGEDKTSSITSDAVKSIYVERPNFGGFIFPDRAAFRSASFQGRVDFTSASFQGRADFTSASFQGGAYFTSASFQGWADFTSASFQGLADFTSASFQGLAAFRSASFQGGAGFTSASFQGEADFESVYFQGEANFMSARFQREAKFDSVNFHDKADFQDADIRGKADFRNTTFQRRVIFRNVEFHGEVDFWDVDFQHSVYFACAKFFKKVSFSLATFPRYAGFADAEFYDEAHFNAIRGEKAFSLAGAMFKATPNFIQAHFEEAPRLDNIEVKGKLPAPELSEDELKKLSPRGRLHHKIKCHWYSYRRISTADRDLPAKWRALKRLAIQGHDIDQELEFHAREMQSQRYLNHWPLPFKFWRASAWLGTAQFWFGYLYEWFSDFGRSIFRPILFWFASILIGAIFYASQNPDIAHERLIERGKGAEPVVTTVVSAFDAWWGERVRCYAGDGKKAADGTYVGSLSPTLVNDTKPGSEALQLAFRNAFIILDSSSEAAHRSYGCLYGVELYGGSNPVAVVPSAVSTASAIQKLFCGLYIFLFGLALRNMLKMK